MALCAEHDGGLVRRGRAVDGAAHGLHEAEGLEDGCYGRGVEENADDGPRRDDDCGGARPNVCTNAPQAGGQHDELGWASSCVHKGSCCRRGAHLGRELNPTHQWYDTTPTFAIVDSTATIKVPTRWVSMRLKSREARRPHWRTRPRAVLEPSKWG